MNMHTTPVDAAKEGQTSSVAYARFHTEVIWLSATAKDLPQQTLVPQPHSSLIQYLPYFGAMYRRYAASGTCYESSFSCILSLLSLLHLRKLWLPQCSRRSTSQTYVTENFTVTQALRIKKLDTDGPRRNGHMHADNSRDTDSGAASLSRLPQTFTWYDQSRFVRWILARSYPICASGKPYLSSAKLFSFFFVMDTLILQCFFHS